MKEKELIFVIPDLRIGGTQRNLIFLINFLIRKEFNIKIIIFDSKKHNMIHLPSKIKIKNLNLYKESKNIFQKIYFNLYRIKKIRSEIKDNKKAIIISFLSTANILTLISCLGLKRKIIINERNDPSKQTIPYIWKFLRFFLYSYAHKIVKNIPDKKVNKQFIHSNKKIIFIPNPLILKEANNNLKKKKIILSVARLTYQKNINLLLEGFSRSDAIKKDWKLVILGSGEEKSDLIKKCRSLKISNNVIFKGFVKNINFWYKIAGIFVSTSRFEGMPNALIEAIYFKSAVIGSNIPGIKYLIKHKYSGLIFKENDNQSLANSINSLIENHNIRKKFSLNAYNYLKKNLRPSSFYKSWINLLND